MICDTCGQDQGAVKLVTRSFGKKKDLLIIENIPVVSCAACGESYMTSETLHEVEHETFEKRPFFVIPAQAGIYKLLKRPDSRFHGNDKLPGFVRNSKVSAHQDAKENILDSRR